MADRKFDISWIAGKTQSYPVPGDEPDSAPAGKPGYPVPGDEPDSASGAGSYGYPYSQELRSHYDLDSVILKTIGAAPKSIWHVVDIAQRAGVEFDDALRSVLRLTARGVLNLLERDPIANDHVVQLTESGREALRS
jgi:hypothetical protein